MAAGGRRTARCRRATTSTRRTTISCQEIELYREHQEVFCGGARQAHGAVQEDDDEYEAYRKRMQLGYKYRPNPLGNPRKQYY